MPEADRANHDRYLKDASFYARRIINRAGDLFGLRKDGSTFAMELNVSQMSAACGKQKK